MKVDHLIDEVIIGLANLNDKLGHQIAYEANTPHNERRLRSLSGALKKASRDAAKIRNARSVVEQICKREAEARGAGYERDVMMGDAS